MGLAQRRAGKHSDAGRGEKGGTEEIKREELFLVLQPFSGSLRCLSWGGSGGVKGRERGEGFVEGKTTDRSIRPQSGNFPRRSHTIKGNDLVPKWKSLGEIRRSRSAARRRAMGHS